MIHGTVVERLRRLLLETFRDERSLDRLLWFAPEEVAHRLSRNSPHAKVINDLLVDAHRGGWLLRLAEEVRHYVDTAELDEILAELRQLPGGAAAAAAAAGAPGAAAAAPRVGFPSLSAMRAAHQGLLKSGGDLSAERRRLIDEFLADGALTGRFLQARAERSAAQRLLDYWLGVLYAQPAAAAVASEGAVGGAEVRDVVLEAFDPSLAPDLADRQCPFLGLGAFVEADAPRFHGREEAVRSLAERVRREPLVLVTGPSGGGKSSLVLAGLLPSLKGSAADEAGGWYYPPVVLPGSDPIGTLLRTLWPAVPDRREWVAEQAARVVAEPGHLRALVSAAAGGRPAVLVVDQFEELFSLCEDRPAAQAYAAALVGLAGGEPANRVVLTLREDFLRDAAALPALGPRVGEAGALFTPAAMSVGELRRVIERPAAMVGLAFDEGIVDDLINEVAGEPTALPLLQFALVRLWEHRDRNRITWDRYREVGQPREALERTADGVYRQLPEDLDRQVARQVFLALVQPSVGIESVRRRVRRESLHRLAAAPRVDGVLGRFVRAGLLRSTPGQDAGDDRFEVAHEALTRNWRLLHDWVQADRERRQQRLRLRAAAEFCRDNGWDPGLLLSGQVLANALKEEDLDPTEQEFVRRSGEAARRAEDERERARQKELEQARMLARAEGERAAALERANASLKRAKIFLTGLLVACGALLVAAPVVTWKLEAVAEGKRRVEEEKRRLAGDLTQEQAALARQQELYRQSQKQKNDQIRGASPSTVPTKSTTQPWKLWPNGSTLRVRFMDGEPALRTRFLDAAKAWLDYANLRLSVVDAEPVEVRVSFAQPGSWSNVGTDALAVGADQPTINLGFLKEDSPKELFDQTVLHEFGHVLGLVHEFQNPRADIRWNKEKVYETLAGPPNNWDREAVDINFFVKYPRDVLPWREFDPSSVMNFTMNGEWLAPDAPKIVQGAALSASDKAFIRTLYPPEAPPGVMAVGTRSPLIPFLEFRQVLRYRVRIAQDGEYTISVNGSKPLDAFLDRDGAAGSGSSVLAVKSSKRVDERRRLAGGAYVLQIGASDQKSGGEFSVEVSKR